MKGILNLQLCVSGKNQELPKHLNDTNKATLRDFYILNMWLQ